MALEPQPVAVLQYLAEHAGQVVSKEELLREVWPGQFVVKAVVKECIRAIRKALHDDVVKPLYIETVGREGYRFLGAVASSQQSAASGFPTLLTPSTQSLAPTVVGRDAELARLHAALRKALNGERQLVFVTGEPGIGKTTVIDAFRQRLEAGDWRLAPSSQAPSLQPPVPGVLWGCGQCIEQYGGGEAYLPILEAMGRLCRDDEGQPIIATLRQYAPTWLVQLSGVIPEAEAQALRAQVQGATQQRMLREMAEAIEAGTTRRPLLLLVEDLHWSDHATVALLSYLAQRREHARLLVIGTYRPADLVLGNHPLKAAKQELQAKRQCEELRLELLSQQDVSDYLTKRFPAHQFPSTLAAEIHQRTEGNALFMVNVVEELLQQGRIIEERDHWTLKGDVTQVNVPDTLRQLIEKQIRQRSDPEQRILEVASVAGTEFAVAALAAALKQDLDAVEETCEDLAWQGHFLAERGIAEWPDGTVSGRYAFRHALYQNVLYDRIAEARRVRLHRLIGERLETAYGEQAKEIAAELAVHFEHGRDSQRAVLYRQQAGQKASQRSANREAVGHLTKGLELLKALPDTPERARQELKLQLALGPPLVALKGTAVPEVKSTYARALELCQQMGETPQLFPTLWGLRAAYISQGEYHTARRLAEQCLRLAQGAQNPTFLLLAHMGMGATVYALGEFVLAREHLEQVLPLYDPKQHNPRVTGIPLDPKIGGLTYLAWALWHLGYPEQAVQKGPEALTLVQELSHPHSSVWALNLSAKVHLYRREGLAVQVHAEAMIRLANEKGFPYWLAEGMMLRGWALAEQGREEEGITQMRQGLAAWRATGAHIAESYFLCKLRRTEERGS